MKKIEKVTRKEQAEQTKKKIVETTINLLKEHSLNDLQIKDICNNADISIGNIVGSNIFNVGGVLGISSMASLKFGGIILSNTQDYLMDFSIMVFAGLLLLLFTIKGKSLGKVKGIIFLIIYIAYVAYLLKTTSVS